MKATRRMGLAGEEVGSLTAAPLAFSGVGAPIIAAIGDVPCGGAFREWAPAT
jgi:hypothetical protein